MGVYLFKEIRGKREKYPKIEEAKATERQVSPA